jgi:hypothetical protein
MLVRYFRRPSRIEQLRSNSGGYLLEGFAKDIPRPLSVGCSAQAHSSSGTLSPLDRPSKPVGRER